ncbi:MAG: phosphate ABC transporter substrate-binding protein [Hahellaceae bacterium]|jgi:ABC-type phosphate transport system substrate-binding protein|nr:phosphate ABC transporter substrate-binding protein [Hahellaceae bacterium]
MKLAQRLVAVTLLSALSAFASAEIAVVVHPSNKDAIDAKEVERIFLGKSKSFPGGAQALPINQSEGGAVRGAFDSGLLGKSASQMKAYWSKLVFTGKGTPPQEVPGDAEVKALIGSNPSTIGYIDAGSVDASVKVVHKF